MLRIIKQKGLPAGRQGFTLIELIVAVGIFGVLSLVCVQALWDTLSTRSKQYGIENSAGAIRPVVATLTQAITEATSIQIADATHIVITGSHNRTIRLNGTTLEQSVDLGPYVTLVPSNVSISSFTISPTGFNPKVVSVVIDGTYSDSLGSHAFTYRFSVSPRAGI